MPISRNCATICLRFCRGTAASVASGRNREANAVINRKSSDRSSKSQQRRHASTRKQPQLAWWQQLKWQVAIAILALMTAAIPPLIYLLRQPDPHQVAIVDDPANSTINQLSLEQQGQEAASSSNLPITVKPGLSNELNNANPENTDPDDGQLANPDKQTFLSVPSSSTNSPTAPATLRSAIYDRRSVPIPAPLPITPRVITIPRKPAITVIKPQPPQPITALSLTRQVSDRTAQLRIVIDGHGDRNFRTLINHAELLANQALAQEFNSLVAQTGSIEQTDLVVLAQRNGQLVPLFRAEIERSQWQSDARVQAWANYASQAEVLLGLAEPQRSVKIGAVVNRAPARRAANRRSNLPNRANSDSSRSVVKVSPHGSD
jgi:hypothetical protein